VEYFAQMLAVFRADKSFTEMEPPAELTEVTTDFEREFNAKGIRTNRASWRMIVA